MVLHSLHTILRIQHRLHLYRKAVNLLLTTREGGARVGGLTGIRERALAMGGWVLVTEEDGEFRVDAWLPWEKGSAAE